MFDKKQQADIEGSWHQINLFDQIVTLT